MLNFRRAASLYFAVVLIGFALAACRSGAIKAEPVEDYTITLKLDKSVYRPGECVTATLKIINNTKKTATVRALDLDSIAFYFGRSGDPERMKRLPVASQKDPVGSMIEIPPGRFEQRTFQLTRFTHYNGSMVAQAHYEPNPPMATGPYPKLYSNNMNFQVTGDPLFERDSDGNLTKKEAIRVAQAQTPGDIKGAMAVMAYDEDTGTNQWLVNVKTVIPGQEPVIKGWIISPYTGMPKGEAHPFPPEWAADPRIQHMSNSSVAAQKGGKAKAVEAQ